MNNLNLLRLVLGIWFLSLLASLEAQVLDASVLHLTMDENSGDTHLDVSGQGHLATFYNIADSNWTAGKWGNALRFYGGDSDTTAYGHIPYAESLNFGSGSFSLSLWVNSSINESTGRYLSIGSLIFRQTSGEVRFRINVGDSKYELKVPDEKVVTGEWVLVTGIRDVAAGELRLYANAELIGTLEGVPEGDFVFSNEDKDLYIGSNNAAKRAEGKAQVLNGALDDIRIYTDKVLDASEIASLVEGTADPLVASWSLDEGAGEVATDKSGAGNDIALINMSSSNWIAGKVESALRFFGGDTDTTGYGKVAYSESLDPGEGPFSVSLWVNSSVNESTGRYISFGSMIFRQTSGEVRFRLNIDDVKKELSVTDEKVVTGEWVMVTAVRDTASHEFRLYANTELIGTLTDIPAGALTFSGEDKSLYIGSNNEAKRAEGKAQVLNGALDEIRIYKNVALDVDDITKIYNAANSVFYQLTLESTTNGTIMVSPESDKYAEGTEVVLTAVGDSGYILDAWGGDASGSTPEITLVMDADKTVSATFKEGVYQYKLTLTTDGDGSGSILGAEDGDIIDDGTEVTLVAKPDDGSAFGGWTGELASTLDSITFVMDKDLTVNANFQLLPQGVTVYEAEDENIATFSEGGRLQNDHLGFSGTGFVDFANEVGAFLEFQKITVEKRGRYEVNVRFANASSNQSNRQLQVDVNGSVAIDAADFEFTGSWDGWTVQTLDMVLDSGENTVKFTALHEEGGPNIDKMEVPLEPAEELGKETLSAKGERLAIYPNPTSSYFTINSVDVSQVEVYSISGHLLLRPERHDGQRYKVDGLPTGMYMVRWITAGTQQQARLLVSSSH